MLRPVVVDTEPFEGKISTGAELRLDRARVENGRFHAHLRHAVFDHVEFYGDCSGHFDGTAEGDFAVSLGEVEVSHGEFGAGDVDREVDFASAAEVFDVAVSAVFWSALVCCRLLRKNR